MSPRVAAALPLTGHPSHRPPCARPDAPSFIDPGQAAEAAAACAACDVATACLLEALRLDADRRAGRDLWGITGMCGGVWFEPGQMPARAGRRALTSTAGAAADELTR